MKNLIAYFSHAGQNYFAGSYKMLAEGNAKKIANKLKALTNADIFEIETIKTYPTNYNECCDVAKKEQESGALPELKTKLEGSKEYSNLILCYPCWWGTMPRAVFTFLKAHDFSGANIYPLCTHEGSYMGHSEADIRTLLPNAHVFRGLAVQGSNAEKYDRELAAWLKQNGLIAQ